MKKKINLIMLYLILSLIVLIPLNIKLVVAADKTVTNQKAVSICGGGLNIDESLLLSALSLCLPGILKKTMEYKELTCQEVKCKYDAVMQGRVGDNSGYSYCSIQYQYGVCKYIVGELFALPILNFVEFLRNILKNIIANPLGIAYGVAVYYARGWIHTKCPGNSCSGSIVRGVALVLTITDILAVTQQLKMMLNAKDMINFNKESACDDIGDIKDKMKEILNGVSSSNNLDSNNLIDNI